VSWSDELKRLLDRLRRDPPDGSDSPDGMEGGISCREAAEGLYEWLDGELDPEAEAAVGTHLETCARCYPRLVFERSFLEAVNRAARGPKAPEGLKERIMQTLNDEEDRSA
jgi:anti-sigma factor (TIGR02949 family)